MKIKNEKRILLLSTLVFLVTLTGLTYAAPGGNPSGPFGHIINILTNINSGLLEVKQDIQAIEAEITNPDHGLAEIKNEVRAIEEHLLPDFLVRSSGLFGLPANAASVDWVIVNNSTVDQTVTVTVYKVGVGAKTVVPPGALDVTIAPGSAFHNANSVGYDQPFVPGFYYEVVVEGGNTNALPSVTIWDNNVNQVIPGTLIPPGSWVTLY